MAIYRIQSKAIDLVFTANIPIKDGLAGKIEEKFITQFLDCVKSLQITSYDLFA